MNKDEILAVDDELPILQMYRNVFGHAGYEVLTAAGGEEALELIAEHPVWVMFLDLKLPGMSGLQLCREIQQQWAMSICFAVTGYASYFEIHECRQAGFEDYFLKPVRVPTLLSAATQAFEKLGRWRTPSPEPAAAVAATAPAVAEIHSQIWQPQALALDALPE